MASICEGVVCVLALFVCGPLLLSLLGSFLSFLQGSASLVGSSMSLAGGLVSVLRCLVSLPGSLLLSLLQSTRVDSSSNGGGGGGGGEWSTGFSLVMMALLLPLLFLFLIHWISLFSPGGGTSGDDDGFRVGLAVITFLLLFALYTLL